MILCFCGHTPLKHISFDELDNPCQVDGCGCSNYVTLTKEQKERLAQLGWGSGTDGQDSRAQERCGCFANVKEECICKRIVGYDAETGIPKVDMTDEEWYYLYGSQAEGD